MHGLNYTEYLKTPQALTFDKMQAIHEELLSEVGNDSDTNELYDMLREACIQYAKVRQEWLLLGRAEKAESDKTRTAYHDSVILQFNVMARYLRQIGYAAAWRDELGDPEANRMFRKTIGDMACYIAFIEGLCAR